MSKPASSAAKAQSAMEPQMVKPKVVADPPKLSRGRRSSGSDRGGLTENEIMAHVCGYFMKGYGAELIRQCMWKFHEVNMTRQEPYQIVRRAALKGWFRFYPPLQYDLRDMLKEKYVTWLKGVDVVLSGAHNQISFQGAKNLMELVKELTRAPHFKKVIHIGFSGGYTIHMIAKDFAELLRKTQDGLPEKIVFHDLMSGFEVEQPFNNPSSFFAYFHDDQALKVKTGFNCLPAPFHTSHFKKLLKCPAVKEVYEDAFSLDIVVTSASFWEDEHSLYRRYTPFDSVEELMKQEIKGDLMLIPFGPKGPILTKTPIMAMTLIKPSQLHKLIKEGLQVLLVIGPCGICGNSKIEALNTLMNLKENLFTHLVTDTLHAGALLDLNP